VTTDTKTTTKPIAITMGDPAGIGPEIVAKLFAQHAAAMQACFVVGDVAVMREASRLIAASQTSKERVINVHNAALRERSKSSRPVLPVVEISSPAQLCTLPSGCLPVLQSTQALAHWYAPLAALSTAAQPYPYGQISAASGQAAADSVIWAARAALRGDIAALVTAPLHKEALAAAGMPYPGHTELLQAEAAAFKGVAMAHMPVRMMLANPELRTVLVSIHMGLRQAIESLSTAGIFETLRITHQALSQSLGRAPRMAVAGLNPHAGEGGLFGREEIELINPAVAQAQAAGWLVTGAHAPDTVFMRARAKPSETDELSSELHSEFDVVIAMYHDQGLIPVKYLGVEHGVNVTLGLPLVRTSPDHGTAFDIAGRGVADPSSLLAALHMARSLVY
jgi:4-hydroxythreonine-4-phosphate dehydrogenase